MADALFDIASGDDNAVQVYPVEPGTVRSYCGRSM